MSANLSANLWSWWLQISVLVAAGGLLAWAFKLREARARLALWHLLLVASMAAFFQPRREIKRVETPVFMTPIGVPMAVKPVPSWPDPRDFLIPILAIGVFARLAWISAGLLQLKRYRRRSEAFALSYEIEDLRGWIAPECEVRLSADVSGPVTFGWRRPVVLLPENCLHLPDSARRAMLCHEFIHVRRRDWIYTLLEGLAGALMWFHPATWWLMGRIHLAREQAVDQETVRCTEAREEYLEALLAVASERVRPMMIPAPLFLKKRHLAKRVAALLKETPMSKPRLFASLSTILCLLAFAARLAILQFPMSAPAQIVRQGGDRLLHRTPIEYPQEAMEKRVEGTVLLDATLDAKGIVTDARVVTGPQELRRAALASVLNWHYAKEAGTTVQIAIEFKAPVEGKAAVIRGVPGGVKGGVVGGVVGGVKGGVIGGIVGADWTLTRIMWAVPESMQNEIRSRLSLQEGTMVTPEMRGKIIEAIREIDEHIRVSWSVKEINGRQDGMLAIMMPGMEASSVPPPPMPPMTDGVQRIRVGGNVQSAKLASQPKPLYPPLARQARIQGTVRFQVLIDKEGNVANVQLINGHPLLVESAFDAVRQWKYQPTMLNGDKVEVVTQIDVNYTLVE